MKIKDGTSPAEMQQIIRQLLAPATQPLAPNPDTNARRRHRGKGMRHAAPDDLREGKKKGPTRIVLGRI